MIYGNISVWFAKTMKEYLPSLSNNCEPPIFIANENAVPMPKKWL